jgi:hypothetical protein
MSNARVKHINVDLSAVTLNNPKETTDGSNGQLIENALEDMGFPIDRSATTDLPGMEVKSKSMHSSADWSIGRMTYAAIVNTPWADSTVKKKMQRQYQVTIAENPSDASGVVTSAKVVDFTNPKIQEKLEAAYEDCRQQLIDSGSYKHGTVRSDIAYFEYKIGNSYQFRIKNAKMKQLISIASAESNPLFDFG